MKSLLARLPDPLDPANDKFFSTLLMVLYILAVMGVFPAVFVHFVTH